MTLPKFKGGFVRWRQFFNEFKALIVNNASLSDCRKLSYLRVSLKGEPLNMISALDITDENFSIALELLIKRYDNKRHIIFSHVRALINIPEIQKETVSNLRTLTDEVNIHVNSLKALGTPVDE